MHWLNLAICYCCWYFRCHTDTIILYISIVVYRVFLSKCSTHFYCLWMGERIVFRFYSNWIEIKSKTIVCVYMYQFFDGKGMGMVDFGIFLLSFHSSNFMYIWLFVAIDADACCCLTLTQQMKEKKILSKYCCITHFPKYLNAISIAANE